MLKLSVEEIESVGEGVWRTALSPADVRRLGEEKSRTGSTSVIGVKNPRFDPIKKVLSADPSCLTVLNVGTSDLTLFLDLGAGAETYLQVQHIHPGGLVGDAAFLQECDRLLGKGLFAIAEEVLSAVRRDFAGELREGLARKWVNHPHNFVALTIQNRDQSFAVHLKGEPEDFLAPSLQIKRDRGTYSRFKLAKKGQVEDAIRVILQSAQNNKQ